METPAQSCQRIVTALEDLVAQEGAALANRDFATMLALQDRTMPLVDFLVASAAAARSEPALPPRIAALQGRRNRNSDMLAAEIERTRTELQQIQATRRRVAQIAPVYGHASAPQRQWQAVG